MNKKNIYITTPIYYASGKPHIGHSYTTVLADYLNKYFKNNGYKAFFLTGTDEHGQKLVSVAEKNNVSTKEYVDQISNIFKEEWKNLEINYDMFIRTTDTKHKDFVQDKIEILIEKGYVYKSEWVGNYCYDCEENYSEINVIIKDNNKLCKIGHNLKEIKEESYFLKVTEFKDFIKSELSQNKVIPEYYTKEMINNFIDNDFTDLAISRKGLKWGIEFKNDKEHVVYVWIDALLNYISALNYNSLEEYKEWWNENKSYKIHLLGKEISRFHIVYWPILLKMLDINQPDKYLIHGWITNEGVKMSKSLNNFVDIKELVNKHGITATKFYLIRKFKPGADFEYSYEDFKTIYNTYLANNYGNLINRLKGMVKSYNIEIDNNYVDQEINNSINQIESLMIELQIDKAIDLVFSKLDYINKLIQDTKPWELYKDNKIADVQNLLNKVNAYIKFANKIIFTNINDTTSSIDAQIENNLFFERIK
jgi:methionyl-tRNA synthetase